MTTENFLLIEKYLENIATKQNLSKNTFLSYKNDIVQFFQHLKANSIKEINELSVRKYLCFVER